MAQQFDENGNPIDPNALDPTESRNQLLDGIGGPVPPPRRLGMTDPPVTDVGQTIDPGTGGPPPSPTPAWTPDVSPDSPAGQEITRGRTALQTLIAPPAPPSADPNVAKIDALYKQYGITDGGNGSGFADRAYWLAHPSEIANGRLAADLAGTGTDQPTGTPGTGPWRNSGQADRARKAAPPPSPGPGWQPIDPGGVGKPNDPGTGSLSPMTDPAAWLQAQMARNALLNGLTG